MRTDAYQKITDQIIAALERGVRPWHQPWKSGHSAGPVSRPLRGNGVPYRGINVVMLWSATMEKGYRAPIWMTFRQAEELKGHVRKGERGSLVVYADKIIRTETDEMTGEEGEQAIPFMKGYTVFNVEQIEGLPQHYYAKPEAGTGCVPRIAHAETFSAATRANVVHGGSRACYVPSTDNIHMPCIDCFEDAEGYYATLAHESVHWTGHSQRLDRDFERKRYGDEGYAMEELVAELGAAFLSGSGPHTRNPRGSCRLHWILDHGLEA
jgi:antirestriction protein ArdC